MNTEDCERCDGDGEYRHPTHGMILCRDCDGSGIKTPDPTFDIGYDDIVQLAEKGELELDTGKQTIKLQWCE